MTVVSDTSPICYLLLIGEVEILSALYGRIFVPGVVAAELGHLEAPLVLRNWIMAPPSWLEIVESNSASTPELDRLQAGEREAILLTGDLEADLVILDDRQARDAALKRGLKVTGLIGILDQAAKRGLISLPEVVERLQKTNFRVDPRLLKNLLDRNVQ